MKPKTKEEEIKSIVEEFEQKESPEIIQGEILPGHETIESPKELPDLKDIKKEEEEEYFELTEGDGSKAEVEYDGDVKPIKRGDGFSFLQRRKLNSNPTSTFIITILFGNGTLKHVILKGVGNTFTYNKKKYHLNKSKSWYDVNFHQNRLLYYEDYVEPLSSKIYIDGDKRYLTLTPDNIKEVMSMEYVKVLAQSQQLSKWLKIAVFLMIANLGLTVINTIVFVLQSGILTGITGR